MARDDPWAVVYDDSRQRLGGYRNEKFESRGLHYVDKGVVNLYNTMWTAIVYVNLKEKDLQIDFLGSYKNDVERETVQLSGSEELDGT